MNYYPYLYCIVNMARGQQSLQHLDFSKPPTLVVNLSSTQSGKGRSSILIQSRNQKLIARYYYYNAIKNNKYEKAVQILISEFDIDDRTISMILRRNEPIITEMRKKKPSVDSFKNQWPHFKW